MEIRWDDSDYHWYKVVLQRNVNTGNGYWYKQNKGDIECTKNMHILINPVERSSSYIYKLY
jgi:hypothetical protein